MSGTVVSLSEGDHSTQSETLVAVKSIVTTLGEILSCCREQLLSLQKLAEQSEANNGLTESLKSVLELGLGVVAAGGLGATDPYLKQVVVNTGGTGTDSVVLAEIRNCLRGSDGTPYLQNRFTGDSQFAPLQDSLNTVRDNMLPLRSNSDALRSVLIGQGERSIYSQINDGYWVNRVFLNNPPE